MKMMKRTQTQVYKQDKKDQKRALNLKDYIIIKDLRVINQVADRFIGILFIIIIIISHALKL